MKKVLKTIACLYAVVAAVNAEDIVFDGNSDHGVIKFDIETYGNDSVDIKKVRIDGTLLPQGSDRDVTLIIPSEVQGRLVHIKEKAFCELNSNHLKLKIQFKKVSGSEHSKYSSSFVQLPEDCGMLFYNSRSITDIDLSGASSLQVKSTRGMFSLCMNLKNINLDNFNTWQIEDMASMFSNCRSLVELDLKDFHGSKKLETMASMFRCCHSLQKINFSKYFDTSNVTNMMGMFYKCKNLENLDLSNFNTSNVTAMNWMFADCTNLKHLNLSSFNTTKVTNMRVMFFRDQNLQELDLTSFNTTNVTNMESMFYKCHNLARIKCTGNFVIPQNHDRMFEECNAEIIH